MVNARFQVRDLVAAVGKIKARQLPAPKPAVRKERADEEVQTDAWQIVACENGKAIKECNARIDLLSARVGSLYKRLREHKQKIAVTQTRIEEKVMELEGVMKDILSVKRADGSVSTLNVVNNIKG